MKHEDRNILAETDKLVIRNWLPEDVRDYVLLVSDAHVMRFIGNGAPQNRIQAKAYVLDCVNSYHETGWCRFVVELKKTGKLIGFCGYKAIDDEIDFGWRYSKQNWRKGYATEAAKAVLNLEMHRFNFSQVICVAQSKNHASVRIIEKWASNLINM